MNYSIDFRIHSERLRQPIHVFSNSFNRIYVTKRRFSSLSPLSRAVQTPIQFAQILIIGCHTPIQQLYIFLHASRFVKVLV